jgi:methyl-accepting chemotaxis protein
MNVPWRALLRHAPTLVEAARRVGGRGLEPARGEPVPPESAAALRRAVDDLQRRAVQQAALIEDLAKELREMAIAVEALRARVRLVLAVVAVALAVAVVAVVLGR